MGKLTIYKIDENLNDILKDYGFNIFNDLDVLDITPNDLTELIKENQDHIELNRKAIIFQIERILINKNRLPFKMQGKSNGLRLYAIIDRTFDMAIIPLRVYSAKNKPKKASKEEKVMKEIAKDFYESRKGGGN